MVNPRQGKGFLPAGSIFTIRRSRWAFSPPIQLDDQPTPNRRANPEAIAGGHRVTLECWWT